MASNLSSLRNNDPGDDFGPRDFMMTYRHWFVISLLVLLNVVIFGCLLLAVLGKIHVGF